MRLKWQYTVGRPTMKSGISLSDGRAPVGHDCPTAPTAPPDLPDCRRPGARHARHPGLLPSPRTTASASPACSWLSRQVFARCQWSWLRVLLQLPPVRLPARSIPPHRMWPAHQWAGHLMVDDQPAGYAWYAGTLKARPRHTSANMAVQ